MPTQTPKDEPGEPDFETALKELEGVVATLEKGDVTLDESLKSFERGIKLTRVCQKALADAEQKVDILLKDGDTEPFKAKE
jgi:exodeoxyribonuclease VII small subunit